MPSAENEVGKYSGSWGDILPHTNTGAATRGILWVDSYRAQHNTMQRQAVLLCLLLAGQCNAGYVTDEQKAWYSEVVLNGNPDDPITENFGKDNIAWGHKNEFGICKGTAGGKADNVRAELAGGAFTVDPVCLPMSLKAPEGGVMGDQGGRVLWTISNENVCTGSPFRVATAAVPNDPNGALLVSWAEDFSYKITGEENGRIHLTRFERDGSGAYQIVKDIMLKGCVQNGGIVYNKRGDIATMCFGVCKACDPANKRYEPFIVEVKPDLSKEIRRKSIMRPECAADNKYCYPKSDGATLQWLEYDPVRDVYAAWHGGGWDTHVADVLTVVEADPSKEMPIACGGWSWSCIGGHTEGTRFSYHPEWEDFGALCTSDLPDDNGLSFTPVLKQDAIKIADAELVGAQSESTWPGAIVPCGCHFYATWHGIKKQGDYAAGKTTDFAFARIDPITRKILKLKWIKGDSKTGEKSTRLAVLGDGKGCNRFLIGWGEMNPWDVYPTNYKMAEIDSEGEFLTETLDVTAHTTWGEDEPWETLANGDVAWGTTWKRNNDGSPSKVGEKPDGSRVRADKGCGCTYHGSGTGYGYALVNVAMEKPTWGECKDQPGGCQERTWGTSGFKTNEFFISSFRASQRVGALTSAGSSQTARDRHPECPAKMVPSGSCRPEIDECLAMPCGDGQTCTEVSLQVDNDYTCTCDVDAKVTATGAPASCPVDECLTTPCSADQTCEDKDTSDMSLNDFVCTCNENMTVTATGSAATCTLDECEAKPCGDKQTCADPAVGVGSRLDFTCTCDADVLTTQVGAAAVCELDECVAMPCPGQDCVDPKMIPSSTGDFVCTCTTGSGSGTGAPATCAVDECEATPCGAGQDCVDANTAVASVNDYTCTCKAPATGTKMGGAATCEIDECATSPCGVSGQTCEDKNKGAAALDFTCTCANGVVATGGAATCDVDECLAKPCGDKQTCKDPDTSALSKNNFVCTCDNDNTLTSIDGPATCFKDECEAKPCGDKQTCVDPVQTFRSLNDFTCTCDEDSATQVTGASATCILKECEANPCGDKQTCADPNTKYSSQGDFVCTCDNDNTVTATGAPASCPVDECLTTPCSADQTCEDKDTSDMSLNDFVCTCKDDMTVTATGSAATCTLDECESKPCGDKQTCADPNTKYKSQGDFVCTCDNDNSATATGAPVSCPVDECLATPCSGDQTCEDKDTSAMSLNDFVCTCKDDMTVTATGSAATCTLDECEAKPCGDKQTCVDSRKGIKSTLDFACTCDADVLTTQVGAAAVCELDECVAMPCPGQDCVDPKMIPSSTGDFVCTCTTGVGSGTGAPAICVPLVDECTLSAIPICGLEQTCKDVSQTTADDFVCTCDKNESQSMVGGPATCVSDECKPSNPCRLGQACSDPVPTPDSIRDFTCTCSNGVAMKGGSATCELDECEDQPCGMDQTCVDEDKRFTSRKDFLCECLSTGTKARGQPADCSDKVTSAPGIESRVPATMPPDVPPTLSPTYPPGMSVTDPPRTAAPTLAPGTKVTRPLVVTAARRKWNETQYKLLVSEKTKVPVDRIDVAVAETTEEARLNISTTFIGEGGGDAVEVLKADLNHQQGSLQDMGIESFAAPLGEGNASADDDIVMPIWLCLAIAGACFILCLFLLTVSVIAKRRSNTQKECAQLEDFAEEELHPGIRWNEGNLPSLQSSTQGGSGHNVHAGGSTHTYSI